MKKIVSLLICACLSLSAFAQIKLEKLDRGLVAVKVEQGVFLSWRITGEEWFGARYNVYRDDIKINETPLEVSNFTDKSGNSNSNYSITRIINGVEEEKSTSVTPWSQQYKEITLDVPPPSTLPDGIDYEYNPGDCSIADVDNDMQYEIVVKWSSVGKDNSQAGYTGNVILDAYELDGSRLWRIDLGINIRAGEHYTQFMLYDLDGDGKAELACKTAPGTKDASGEYISKGPAALANHAADYRNGSGYILSGPEFLTIFNGETGIEMATVAYNPARGSVDSWGDGYGNRVDRFLGCVAYLDGKKPSLVMTRGYYAKTVLAAWDWNGSDLTQRWTFDSTTSGNGAYAGQGNHNLSVADVDGDGKDEIIFGSMTIDDDGTGLYNTHLGHGDAMHVGDLDPYRKGLEAFRCLEHSPHYGTVYHDAATGDVLIHHLTSGDCGRCCAANVSDDIKGIGMWGGGKLFSSATQDEHDMLGWMPENFRIYWDGDLLEEMLDKNWDGSKGVGTIRKYNVGEILRADGAYSSNWTKGTPNIQADLLGDWREEVIWKTLDNKLRIYTTTDETEYRNYTLMHDRQYRLSVAWQNVAYNQPPHVSYFLGKAENITVPPPPIFSNGRLVYKGNGSWDKTTIDWEEDGSALAYSDGKHVHLDNLENENMQITLEETVSPSVLSINAISDITLDASSGALSGSMILCKQGKNTFSLSGSHDYTGTTEVWDGCLDMHGSLSQSPVWLNLFGELGLNGEVAKGIVMRYGSELFVGGKNVSGVASIGDSLDVEDTSVLEFDLFAPLDNRNDSIIINGKLNMQDHSIIRIVPHLEEEEIRLTPGVYTLAHISGTISCNPESIQIEGIMGTPAELSVANGKLILTIKDMREASSVVWTGSESNQWDLVQTTNFKMNEIKDVFVTDDTVLFIDDAIEKNIIISETVSPNAIIFNNNEDFTFTGNGSIAGESTITKSGTGTISISNINHFTGKVLIEDGAIEVPEMPNKINGDAALGVISEDVSLLEINGGTLRITGETESDRAMKIGSNDGTIYTSSTVNWNSKITGETLNKSGNGELVFHQNNTINELVLKSGSVRLANEESQPGSRVTFMGGTLVCYDNGGSYSNASYPLYVPEGYTGTMYLDGRCSYNNTLTGSGTFNVNTPWIRNDFNGNWSAFSGTINIKTTTDGHFRINNSYGYPNAIVNIETDVYATHLSGGKVKIGTLAGTPSLGNAIWEVGHRNEDFVFRGKFNEGSFIKVGTGTMTLMGASTTSGTTTVNEGTLLATNFSGSATGTGSVYVNTGAFLGGNGTISGNILVRNGGSLYASIPNRTGLSLKAGNVSLSSGSNFIVNTRTNTSSGYSDKITISNRFSANGTLVLNKMTDEEYSAGQSFQIVSGTNIIGSFSSISPETPGEGLAWDLSEFNTSGKIFVVQTTDIKNNKVEILNIFPNPSDGLVYVSSPNFHGTYSIQIETLNGQILSKEVYDDASSKITLNMSEYAKGIYLIRAVNQHKIAVNKLVLK